LKWNLKRLALAAEVAGGIGIIISLLYVANEVSKNNANIELSNHLALSNQLAEIRLAVIESNDLGLIIERGNADPAELDSADRVRYDWYAQYGFGIWETAYFMHENVLLPLELWETWDRGWCSFYINSPGFLILWQEKAKRNASEGFIVHVESYVGQ